MSPTTPIASPTRLNPRRKRSIMFLVIGLIFILPLVALNWHTLVMIEHCAMGDTSSCTHPSPAVVSHGSVHDHRLHKRAEPQETREAKKLQTELAMWKAKLAELEHGEASSPPGGGTDASNVPGHDKLRVADPSLSSEPRSEQSVTPHDFLRMDAKTRPIQEANSVEQGEGDPSNAKLAAARNHEKIFGDAAPAKKAKPVLPSRPLGLRRPAVSFPATKNAQRGAHVKRIMTTAWSAYRKHAWGTVNPNPTAL
jgi:hypothetical protein